MPLYGITLPSSILLFQFDFSSETLKATKQWDDIIKVLKGKDYHPRILLLVKLYSKNEVEIKTVIDTKLRKIICLLFCPCLNMMSGLCFETYKILLSLASNHLIMIILMTRMVSWDVFPEMCLPMPKNELCRPEDLSISV